MRNFPFLRVASIGMAALICCACAEPPQAEAPASATPPPKDKPAAVAVAAPRPGLVTQIALVDFLALQQTGEVLIYDVRPVFFHSIGHIPGAVSWPKSAYEKQLATREPEIRLAAQSGHPVVLYCTDFACPDARVVAARLSERGHNTSVLVGGWDAWLAGGLPGS